MGEPDASAVEWWVFVAGVAAAMIGAWLKGQIEAFTSRDDKLEAAGEKQGDTVSELKADIRALQATVAHIASDQEAHRRQGEQLAGLVATVARLDERSLRVDGWLKRIDNQNRMIWAKLHERPPARATNGATAH